MVSNRRLLIMRSLSFMDQVVSGTMVGLCMVIVLIKPPAHFQRDSKEFGLGPDVKYRVERVWRRVPESEIARQAKESWDETKIENVVNIEVLPDKRWWLTKKYHNMKRDIGHWYSDQQLLSQFKDFYRTDPRNWPLYDIGITRNGIPLPIPDDLKLSIWRHHMLLDQQQALLVSYSVLLPKDYAHIIGTYEDQHEKLSEWIDHNRKQNELKNIWNPDFTNFSVDEFDSNTEAFYAYPYLILFRDGKMVGVFGGIGQFDCIPDDWKPFCVANQILLNK